MKTLFFVLAASVFLSSCKKDECETCYGRYQVFEDGILVTDSIGKQLFDCESEQYQTLHNGDTLYLHKNDGDTIRTIIECH